MSDDAKLIVGGKDILPLLGAPIGAQAAIEAEARRVQKYVFTFGGDHIWPLTGTSMFKNYVVIEGDYFGARNEMVRRFGNRWSGQYPHDECIRPHGIINEFKLAELRLEFPDGKTVFQYDL